MLKFVKFPLTLWLSSLLSFGFVAIYVLSQEDSINAPGELREVFVGAGLLLSLGLILLTAIFYSVKSN